MLRSTFIERVYKQAYPIWQQSHQHPFVQGMADGSLAEDKFQYYICQDYLYLIEYAKLYGLAAVKATDLKSMEMYASLMHATLHFEMEHHRNYAEKIGITREQLEQTKPASMTLAYTSFMLQIAYRGSLTELLAVLLPCTWSYWEMGKSLAEVPGSLQHLHYREWILLYSSTEFSELAKSLISEFERLTDGLPERELAHLEELFIQASKFEWLFWDMSYRKDSWSELR
jgi:thiaminase/transcriptional activator TenA